MKINYHDSVIKHLPLNNNTSVVKIINEKKDVYSNEFIKSLVNQSKK